MWQCLHGGSTTQAILELAKKFSLVFDAEYRELLLKFGLDDRYRRLVDRPWFDEPNGKLWFGDQLIRCVDTARAANTLPILGAFQQAKWPPSIDGIDAGEWSTQQRLDAVRCLNRGLSGIRFHSRDSIISWQATS